MKLTKEQLKQIIQESLNELDYSATDFRDDPKLGQYPGQVTTYHEPHYKWAKRGSDNEYYENDMWPVRKIANMLPQNKPLDSNLYSKAPLTGQAPIIIRDPDVAKKISNQLKPTFDKKFNKYYQLTAGMPKGFTLDDGWFPAQFHPEVAKIMSDRTASSKGVPYGTEPIDRGDAEKEMMKATDTTARVRVPESKFKLSKKQLQQIIKEELGEISEIQKPSLKDVLDKAAEINKAQGGLGLTAKEAIKAMHNEVDPPTQDQLNYLNDKFPGYDKHALKRLYDETTGDFEELEEEEQKMKLTKEQLQRIIKEELQSVMSEERTWKPGIYGIDDQGRLADGPFENIEDLRTHYSRSYGGDAGNEKVESGEYVYSLVHPDKKGDMSLETLEGGLMFLSRNDSAAAASIIGYLEDGLNLETAIEASDEKLSPKELAGLGLEPQQ